MQPPLAQSLRLAADVVAAVIGGRALDDALAACWAGQGEAIAAARAAVQDLAYTTLRTYGRGDFFLARLMAKPLSSLPVRALLLVALARLDARPQDAHVTVDQAVEAAVAQARGRFKALVNGVLRSFLRRRDELTTASAGDEVAHWQHPHGGWRGCAPIILTAGRRLPISATVIRRWRCASIAAALRGTSTSRASRTPASRRGKAATAACCWRGRCR